MSKQGISCPSCGESMPQGLEVCLFCQTPLKPSSNPLQVEKSPPAATEAAAVVRIETRGPTSSKRRATRGSGLKKSAAEKGHADDVQRFPISPHRPTVLQGAECLPCELGTNPAYLSSFKAKIAAGIVGLLLLASIAHLAPTKKPPRAYKWL